ncbi:MAG: hypothetical protein MUC97_04230 [Bernardetiaceae bacterium]|nr:hypothetical protein [Bernardetiaceae bacterium]
MPPPRFITKFVNWADRLPPRWPHPILMILLTLANLLWLAYWLEMGYLYHPMEFDEFTYLAIINERGNGGYVNWTYEASQARLLSNLLVLLALRSYQWWGNLLPFFAAQVVVVWGAFSAGAYACLRPFAGAVPEWARRWLAFNLGGLLLATCYLTFATEAGTFYWLVGSAYCFGGIAAGLFTLAFILSPSRHWLTWLGLAVAALYAGNSLETYGLFYFTLLTLALSGLWLGRRWQWAAATGVALAKTALAWAMTGAGLAALLGAEVTQKRQLGHETVTLRSFIGVFRQNLPHFFNDMWAPGFQVHLLALPILVLLYVGAYLRPAQVGQARRLAWLWATSGPVFIGLVVLAIAPMVYLTSGIQVARPIAMVAMVNLAVAATLAFFTAYWGQLPRAATFWMALFATLVFGQMGKNKWVNETYTARRHRQEYTPRLQYLRQLARRPPARPDSVVVVPTVAWPPGGTFPYTELSANPDHKANLMYCRAHQLPFKISVRSGYPPPYPMPEVLPSLSN